MGMSMHVTGIRDKDVIFKKMMEAKKFCDDRQLSYPKEVSDFFGKLIREKDSYIEEEFTHVSVPHREWVGEFSNGFEIEVAEIPKDTKVLRFYCSY